MERLPPEIVDMIIDQVPAGSLLDLLTVFTPRMLEVSCWKRCILDHREHRKLLCELDDLNDSDVFDVLWVLGTMAMVEEKLRHIPLVHDKCIDLNTRSYKEIRKGEWRIWKNIEQSIYPYEVLTSLVVDETFDIKEVVTRSRDEYLLWVYKGTGKFPSILKFIEDLGKQIINKAEKLSHLSRRGYWWHGLSDPTSLLDTAPELARMHFEEFLTMVLEPQPSELHQFIEDIVKSRPSLQFRQKFSEQFATLYQPTLTLYFTECSYWGPRRTDVPFPGYAIMKCVLPPSMVKEILVRAVQDSYISLVQTWVEQQVVKCMKDVVGRIPVCGMNFLLNFLGRGYHHHVSFPTMSTAKNNWHSLRPRWFLNSRWIAVVADSEYWRTEILAKTAMEMYDEKRRQLDQLADLALEYPNMLRLAISSRWDSWGDNSHLTDVMYRTFTTGDLYRQPKRRSSFRQDTRRRGGSGRQYASSAWGPGIPIEPLDKHLDLIIRTLDKYPVRYEQDSSTADDAQRVTGSEDDMTWLEIALRSCSFDDRVSQALTPGSGNTSTSTTRTEQDDPPTAAHHAYPPDISCAIATFRDGLHQVYGFRPSPEYDKLCQPRIELRGDSQFQFIDMHSGWRDISPHHWHIYDWIFPYDERDIEWLKAFLTVLCYIRDTFPEEKEKIELIGRDGGFSLRHR